jgi:hypothetical protein
MPGLVVLFRSPGRSQVREIHPPNISEDHVHRSERRIAGDESRRRIESHTTRRENQDIGPAPIIVLRDDGRNRQDEAGEFGVLAHRQDFSPHPERRIAEDSFAAPVLKPTIVFLRPVSPEQMIALVGTSINGKPALPVQRPKDVFRGPPTLTQFLADRCSLGRFSSSVSHDLVVFLFRSSEVSVVCVKHSTRMFGGCRIRRLGRKEQSPGIR